MVPHFIVLSYWQDFWTAFKREFIEEIRIGDIGAEIQRAIEPKILFSFSFLNRTVLISDAVVVSWVVLIVIFFLAWFLGRKREMIPTSFCQIISESLVDILMSLCKSCGMDDQQAERVVPFVGAIGIFITLTNLSSMLKIPPPSKNPSFPIALAVLTILYVIFMSMYLVGPKGFWQSLTHPKAMLLPFKLLDFLIKPISLALRLFGNIFGAFILMEFIYIVIPVFLPGLIGLWFDLADGILQGVIFTYLSATYIGEIVEGTREAAHAGEEAKAEIRAGQKNT